jgi:hypothetical protein
MVDPPSEVSQVIQAVGPVGARAVLRYQIGEANREMFSAWCWAQLFLGVLILGFHLFALPVQKLSIALAATMLLLAAVMKFLMLPNMRQATSHAELQPGATTIPDRQLFLALHQGFTAFEVAIVILGLALIWTLFRRREQSSAPPTLDVSESLLPPLR